MNQIKKIRQSYQQLYDDNSFKMLTYEVFKLDFFPHETIISQRKFNSF